MNKIITTKEMEMDKTLEKAMNEQVTKELFSAYLYLSMAAYFDAKNLPGFSHWMKIQAQEEMLHGMKFYIFLNNRGCKVELGAFEKPECDFKSIKDVFEKTLEHEKVVTASINNLYSIATKVNDNASIPTLQWFINEQIEEEKNPTDILARLSFIKEDSTGIIMLDQELGARPQPVLDPAALV